MFSLLIRARLSFSLDQHLSASVVHLKDESLKLFKRYIAYLEVCKFEEQDFGNDTDDLDRVMTLLNCEISYCQQHFYKNEKAEASLTEAKKLSNLSIEFGGKLGRRTRYQQNDVAQLTVDFDTRDVKLNIVDVNSTLNDDNEREEKKEGVLKDGGVFKPDLETQKYLQSESIYFPDGLPKLNEGEKHKELSEKDIILLQAFTFYQYRQLPNDEHREVILRPLSTILSLDHNKKNWLLDTNALLLKSRNDYERTKTKERSLIYFQGILDSYRTQESSFFDKASCVFAVNYPLRWNLQKELAMLYKSMGCFVAAFELLNEVQLTEDAITCLFSAGRMTQAIEIAEQFLNDTCVKDEQKQDASSSEESKTTSATEEKS